MSSKKKSTKPAPVEIKFTFLLQSDGSILAAYEGYDKRTHAVGKAVLDAIAAEYDWQVTAV
jgi:hypothetical protein